MKKNKGTLKVSRFGVGSAVILFATILLRVSLGTSWAGPAAPKQTDEESRSLSFRVAAAQNRLRQDPTVLDAQFQLGEAYYAAGQYTAARNHFRLYLAKCAAGVDSVQAAHLHARALLGSGLRLRATRALKTLVRAPEAPAEAWHDLALLMREDHLGPEAAMAEMRALELQSHDEKFLRESAAQWKERRSFHQSVFIFEKLQQSGKAEAADYFELGYLYHRLRRMETARRYYETTLLQDDGHPEAHYNLAVLDQKDRAIDSAVFHLREVMRVRPSYGPAYFDLAQLFLGEDRKLEAEQVFVQYLGVATDSSAIHEAESMIEELRYERSQP